VPGASPATWANGVMFARAEIAVRHYHAAG